jgi:hypothetical protein
MKIKQEEIESLTHIAKVNPQIKITSDEIAVVSEGNKCIVYWAWGQEVKRDYGIYDMNNLLNLIKLHDIDSMVINEQQDQLEINSETGKNTYRFEAENLNDIFIVPPNKDKFFKEKLHDMLSEFKLTSNEIEIIQKQSNVLGTPHLTVEADKIRLCDETDSSMNIFEKKIEIDNVEKSCIMASMFDKMKIIDYTVKVYKTAIVFDSDEFCYVHVKLSHK